MRRARDPNEWVSTGGQLRAQHSSCSLDWPQTGGFMARLWEVATEALSCLWPHGDLARRFKGRRIRLHGMDATEH